MKDSDSAGTEECLPCAPKKVTGSSKSQNHRIKHCQSNNIRTGMYLPRTVRAITEKSSSLSAHAEAGGFLKSDEAMTS